MRTTPRFGALALLGCFALAACLDQGEAPVDEDVPQAAAAVANGTYTVRLSVGSNKCLDVAGSGTADGTKIQEWTCNGSGAQLFRVENQSNGQARLVNPQSNKCLDIAGAGTADGTQVQLWTCNGTGAQSFQLADAGAGKVTVKNPSSGKCVDVNAAGTTDGTKIQLWTCNGTVAQSFQIGTAAPAKLDVTFFVVSDTHADPPLQYDLRAMARAINTVAVNGSWPAQIGGATTNFVGGAIGAPSQVVFTGDLMGWGVTPTELQTFRHYFEQGASGEAINFRSMVGLGNHDLDDADRPPDLGAAYRAQIWAYVDQRHKGGGAPVPVTAYDAASHAYSWDVAGVHFVQLHRFPGDTNYGLTSSLGFLSSDLQQRASDGKPVFLFHHYAMDAFGTQDRWWTAAQRAAYRAVLGSYNVAAILGGHSHGAMQYTWEGKRVFQVNNAKAENGTGNNDGNGSFAIVRITATRLDVVTCRWLDDQGHYEMIGPYYSGPAKL
jgi:cytolysin (calcineurin-like family phosphatase)